MSILYDDKNRKVSTISRKGEISTANYDHLGRKTSLSIPNMGVYSYEYNIMGQAVKVSHGSEAIRYIYDDLGRVVRETDGAGRHMDYAYNDAAGTWDIKYNVTNSSHYWLRYATDDAGRLSSIKEYGTNTLATYRYDTLSRVKSVAFGNGTVKNVTYEASGQLKSLKHNFTGTADDATWLYGRNNNGQVTSKSISNAGYQWTPSFKANTLYSANALNQYYNIGGIEQKHDKNGNLIQDGSMNFVFNALGQMTEAKSGGMIVGKYEYDPLGRRKAKTAGGLKTEYLWSGNQVMAEYRGGRLLRRYIYGAGIDNPIALISGNGTKTYIHKDALGSVVALSNNAGVVTDKFSYSPFGKSADESGSPYKFAARRIDSETGLYYNRNRYYNPSTGRFISPDPIGYGDGMNMYAYVKNDPMNGVDPMGLFANESEWETCSIPGYPDMDCTTVTPRIIINKSFIKILRGAALRKYLDRLKGAANLVIKIGEKFEEIKKSLKKLVVDEGSLSAGLQVGIHTKFYALAGVGFQLDAGTFRGIAGSEGMGIKLTQGANAHISFLQYIGESGVMRAGDVSLPSVVSKKPLSKQPWGSPSVFVGLNVGASLLFGFNAKIGFDSSVANKCVYGGGDK